MASSDRDVGDDDKSPFRCLPAARFAAACLMTVLVLVVLVKAITVVHRDETLSLSLVKGAIFATRIRTPAQQQQQLLLDFNLRARNPSNFARMYYYNVTAYLFDTSAPAASSNPERDSFIYFSINSLELQQGQSADAITQVNGTRQSMYNSSFDMLYSSSQTAEGIMSDVTMRLDGLLTFEVASGHNRTSRRTYYCWPLVVGPDLSNVKEFLGLNLKDVFCREVQGRHFI
ncbi:hypothetical protein C2845_PM09G01120 [Panicum miliaceum]|uniref:Late embryogenesis abundant protein LEA-2 subgroup domain-containing protein n=1 Tax=Panicum miliaceum TaxID=4540 RepID=A0A3L6S2E5_PANMI|nr:hypothetical protein C2845_PM09G01120 [Panicum miliaceum]